MDGERIVEVHGHARAFRLLGTGPTVLLLVHGIGSDGDTWDIVAPALAERYTVIVPDLLGHGRSAKPRADYSIGGYANGMRDLLGTLDIDRVTVVGHSFGGGVAMQFAYQFPERTDRLVVVAGGGLGSQVSVAFRALTLPGASLALRLSQLPPSRLALGALRAAAGLVAPAALAADLNEAYTVHTGLRDPAARSAFLHVLRHVADWRGQLITMRDRAYLTQGLPALVIWGDQDHVLPVSHAEAAASLMPGARSVVLPGVGHFPHREAPEEFVRALTDFVERTEPKRWDAGRWRRLLQTHSYVGNFAITESSSAASNAAGSS
ncbi:alpha/beta hydrolase [Actinoplanes sp. KI2]|uniref:alpha/beta fold hydrolase n=1 Tax=Actinoplanes sp. KI2 TaxID=2983315 RepID=UPI0021D5B2E7|nr:alpha/beta hydrolase [Actinoplanes sp. KI2]MCU7727053.1 alpha/beta hydrolase [Actinoplanes sp. KI2]